jgi:hypothetical protein
MTPLPPATLALYFKFIGYAMFLGLLELQEKTTISGGFCGIASPFSIFTRYF